MMEHLHSISVTSKDPVRPELLPALQEAIRHDIKYELPNNYMKGAGDTYFSGKMLGKLARIIQLADEFGDEETKRGSPAFVKALDRLRRGVQVWLDGTSLSPLLYDRDWGGIVMCGCDYDGETEGCKNKFPVCPALVDAGSNFGAGYYNDHHYHFGYHIYAAAIVSKFDHAWARKFHQHVLLLVRDIANPSDYDPHFPVFRHKDW